MFKLIILAKQNHNVGNESVCVDIVARTGLQTYIPWTMIKFTIVRKREHIQIDSYNLKEVSSHISMNKLKQSIEDKFTHYTI